MSSITAPTPPYKSRVDFLANGVTELQLSNALDCSICREPLEVAPEFNLPHHLTSPSSSTVHLTAARVASPTSSITSHDTAILKNTSSVTQQDTSLALERAARIYPCSHIFGRTCLETWFSTSTSDRCPECNLKLFPNLNMKLFLRWPTLAMRIAFAAWIEESCEDLDAAAEVRARLMSDWVADLIRETALSLWEQQGYEVEWEYIDGEEDENDDDSAEDNEDEEGEEDEGKSGETIMDAIQGTPNEADGISNDESEDDTEYES